MACLQKKLVLPEPNPLRFYHSLADLGEGKYLIPGPSSLPVSPKSLLHTVPPMLKLAIIPEIRTRNKQTKL